MIRPGLIALGAAACGAGILAGILLAAGSFEGGRTTATTFVSPARTTPAAGAESTPAGVYVEAAPGVVDVSARVHAQVRTPYGTATETVVESGAGSVLDRRGHILTAEHVIAHALSITVELQDGSSRRATVAGRDAATDLAVLKIDPAGLKLQPIALGSSRSLRIGDVVFAIGDPFGYARSLSGGLVSGLDRTIEAPNGFMVAHAIQTDAALNPGNSGGPLLDSQGRIVGVADQIATGSSQADTNTGVGFAVPVDVAKAALPQLERGEKVTHAYLGVQATDAASSGALVQSVVPGSPAAHAGVEAGDVIVAVGGTKIGGVGDLVAATAAHRPGDAVTLTIVRGSKRVSTTLTLGTEPARATG